MRNGLRAELLALATVIATGCAAQPTGTTPVTRNYGVIQFDESLTPSDVQASSSRVSTNGYSVYGINRAVDGNTDTEWANDGWKERTAWLTLQYLRPMRFTEINIKTGPLYRSHYVVETSNDGYDWRRASGPLRNTTWQMETKEIRGTGRFLRIRWINDDDEPRGYFSIFEVAANGRPLIAYSLQDPYY